MPNENEELDGGWDNLAEDLGLEEKVAPPIAAVEAPAEKPHAADAAEADDFEDGDDGEDDGDETAPAAGSPEGEGKKKRRRRRRRRKKGAGQPDAAASTDGAAQPVAPADSGEFAAVAVEPASEAAVEEGDAPAELTDADDDDENKTIPSAVDEEMTQAGREPRQEWKVMSWADLVSKLYRPS